MRYENQIDESQVDDISSPRRGPSTDRAIHQTRCLRTKTRRDSQDFEVSQRNDSNCSFSVCFMGILIVFLVYLVYGFLRDPTPLSEPRHSHLDTKTPETPKAPNNPVEIEDPWNFTYVDVRFLDFKIGAPSIALSGGYFSTSSQNTDAGRRVLQRMICQSHVKSLCFHKYPAEVVEDLVAVTIIYTPNVSTNTPLLYQYTRDFQSYMQSFGVSTCLLESTTINQEFVMTTPNNEPDFIQLKNDEHFFKRENLLNVAIKKLLTQTKWQIFAWIDAHQMFSNSYWWEEVIIKAPKVGVIQLCQDLSYDSPDNKTTLFARPSYIEKLTLKQYQYDLKYTFHGNAWAISRDLYKKIGYIYDEGICGSTDYIFAVSTQHNGPELWKELKKDNYFKTAIPWLKRVAPIFNNKVSFVRGSIRHFEHERTFNYPRAIEYIRRTFKETSLLDVLQRKDDFSLSLNDSIFKYFEVMN